MYKLHMCKLVLVTVGGLLIIIVIIVTSNAP